MDDDSFYGFENVNYYDDCKNLSILLSKFPDYLKKVSKIFDGSNAGNKRRPYVKAKRGRRSTLNPRAGKKNSNANSGAKMKATNLQDNQNSVTQIRFHKSLENAKSSEETVSTTKVASRKEPVSEKDRKTPVLGTRKQQRAKTPAAKSATDNAITIIRSRNRTTLKRNSESQVFTISPSKPSTEKSSDASPKTSTPEVSQTLKNNRKRKGTAPPLDSNGLDEIKWIRRKTNKKEPKPTKKAPKNSVGDDDFQIGLLPPQWTPNSNTNSSTSTKGEKAVCSVSCPLSEGVVPTLQCSSCLCLFHYECCNVNKNQTNSSFVCKNCRNEIKPNENSVASEETLANNSNVSVMEKVVDSSAEEVKSVVEVPVTVRPKIIDGVTTWLPSSSSIQISSSLDSTNASSTIKQSLPSAEKDEPVQFLTEIGGKSYIAVVKNTVMSISQDSDSSTSVAASSEDIDNKTNDSKAPGSSEISNATASKSVNVSALEVSETSSPDSNAAGTVMPTNSYENTTGILIVPCSSTNAAVAQQNYKEPLQNDIDEIQSSEFRLEDLEQSNETNEMELEENEKRELESSFDSPLEFCFSKYPKEMRNILLGTLSYLKVEEILKVARVNKTFNDIAMDACLWKSVKMKNSKVYDWDGCANTLRKNNTVRLDLRKMLFASKAENSGIWASCVTALSKVDSLTEVYICRCSPAMLDSFAAACSHISILNAPHVGSGNVSFENIAKMPHLRELRITSCNGTIEKLKFTANSELLTTLALTGFRIIDPVFASAIGDLKNLKCLILGDCKSMEGNEFNDTLKKLTNLKQLRLHAVHNMLPDFSLLINIGKHPNLKTLELVDVKVEPGFGAALSSCSNIEQLLLVPLYSLKAPIINREVIGGISLLAETLKQFTWGLSLCVWSMASAFQQSLPENENKLLLRRDDNYIKAGPEEEYVPLLKQLHSPVSSPNGRVHTEEIVMLPPSKFQQTINHMLPNSEVKVFKVSNTTASTVHFIK